MVPSLLAWLLGSIPSCRIFWEVVRTVFFGGKAASGGRWYINDLYTLFEICLYPCVSSLAYSHCSECLSLLQQTASISTTVHMSLDQFFVLGHKNLEISVGAHQTLTISVTLGDELPCRLIQAPGPLLLPAWESWGNSNPLRIHYLSSLSQSPIVPHPLQ